MSQENSAKMIEDQPKEDQIPQFLPIKYEAVKILKDNGLNGLEIAKALGVTNGRVSQVVKKLNQNEDLTSKKNVSLASKAHRMILGHFVHPDKIKLDSSIDIKGSDVTKAIDRVYDRGQPVKRESDGPGSVSFIQVNIDKYKCK